MTRAGFFATIPARTLTAVRWFAVEKSAEKKKQTEKEGERETERWLAGKKRERKRRKRRESERETDESGRHNPAVSENGEKMVRGGLGSVGGWRAGLAFFSGARVGLFFSLLSFFEGNGVKPGCRQSISLSRT